ncbi:MAPEG family protein [Methylobacterium oryzihabitans]|uniref:Glutathione S-transferase n=1 Tax=Methylobacterium oryzihabitans TaxID=2499852 RepID=A0A437PC48_9HYPH|nr:MAPEG family protein [Methylobacterium oryzihabitans]RVU19820.1 glutathione S-transferase [Methylobacterium oryzihabitans]
MVFPATTAVYAALLTLVFLALSGWVMARRLSANVLHGTGGDDVLLVRMRSQANFAEYVPLALLLVGLLEAHGAARGLIQGLLALLLVARVLHPVGMVAAKNSAQQFACRGGGILVTMLVMAVAAVALLLRLV